MYWRMFLLISVLIGGGRPVRSDESPLNVFLLVGQSNMQGHAHVRTLDHLGMAPQTIPLLQEIQTEAGTPRVCNEVWITYLSASGEKSGRLTTGFGADENKIGPELTFGIFMHKTLNEPILIIKAAWGGKSLHTDFRPPSAGSFEFSQQQLERLEKQGKDLAVVRDQKAQQTGHYYQLTIDYIKDVLANIEQVVPDYDADRGVRLAGMVWFQGWNDMVDSTVYPNRNQAGGYSQYSELLAHLIRDVRRDLAAPNLPFVIGVLGVGGPVQAYRQDQQRYAAVHQNFRDAMAAPADLPEFEDNVAVVLTENYWDSELAELNARKSKLQRQLRQLQSDENRDEVDLQAAAAKLRSAAFSERELEILETGVSNFEFHYLGSAKIMAQIGRGFAEAMGNLLEESQAKAVQSQ